jgi:hypothetical protein
MRREIQRAAKSRRNQMGDGENSALMSASQKPLLFISHKHEDAEIGEAVAKFVRRVSGGRVDVFLSSNSQFEGPRVGKDMNKELSEALWRAGVIILVYTSQDKDWSWCMWECGVSLEPQSPDTKVVVLRCLKDEPPVFKGSVHVLAWDPASIEGFAKRFLDEDFFPGLREPVTGLSETELSKEAEDLHGDLVDAIPQELPEEWAAWPFLRIQLDREVIKELTEVPSQERLAKTRDALREKATVVDSSSGAPGLFGLSVISRGMVFDELVQEWQESYPDSSTDWLNVIARQLIDGARRRRPKKLAASEWERFRHVGSDAESVPGIGRIRSDAATMRFDLCFFEF